jgi:CheY-like chemotaxis protein
VCCDAVAVQHLFAVVRENHSTEGGPLAPAHQECASQARKTKILLVEDNKIDARLTRQAIQKLADWPSSIDIVDDGEKAIKFLRREQAYIAAEKPDLVILDLNLPKCDGAEVLQMIRSSIDLQDLLVFIFSSTPVDLAEDRMYNAHVKADRYFEKPHDVGSYFSIASQIKDSYRRATSARDGATA